MASFNYDAYAAQRAQRSTNPTGGPQVEFLNSFLKEDGDVVVVRFPYHSMSDLLFETTHSVVFPGRKYPSRVRCSGEGCPFCAQGVKLDTRFFAKLLAYVVDETSGEVKLINTVWDRPAAFADIDIKNLMQEYGDISQYLFKIKRNGTGTATRYTMSIIMNTTVYNPAVYKADFAELDQIDPVRILSKSIAQYNEAVNPGSTAPAAPAPAQHALATAAGGYAAPSSTAPHAGPTPQIQPTHPDTVGYAPQAPAASVPPAQTVQQDPKTTEEPQRRTTRYQF